MEVPDMQCPKCSASNDSDARFCTECGSAVETIEASPAKAAIRRPYLYALLLFPVLLLAAGIGYYKFFLPQGIAAVVNGETIGISELDQQVARVQGPGKADPGLRYQMLNGLITERLVLQQVRSAGISLSQEELNSAVSELQAASGLDAAAFEQEAAARYGSMRDFQRDLAQRLLIKKFIAERVVPPHADEQTAHAALARWMQNLNAGASVRITLAEQLSGAGCGCCGKADAARGKGGRMRSGANTTVAKNDSSSLPPTPSSAREKASAAALEYWHQKHGPESVETKVSDFGCHMEIDIIKDGKTVGSLRYQGGRISE
jgi:hypothetical protein